MAKHAKPQKVYVSYAKGDAGRIDGVLARLAQLGLMEPADEVMSDKDTDPKHGSLRDGVRRQIQSASKVVVVWTATSAASQWVNYELGLADAFGKTIIPVVRRGELGSLPSLLQELHAVIVEDDE